MIISYLDIMSSSILLSGNERNFLFLIDYFILLEGFRLVYKYIGEEIEF